MSLSNAYALLIGCNKYDRLGGGALRGCVNDAVGWATLAIDPTRLGMDPAHVFLLVTDATGPGSEPTAAAIAKLESAGVQVRDASLAQLEAVLETLADVLNGEAAGAPVLVSFSGHGAAVGKAAEETVAAGAYMALLLDDARVDTSGGERVLKGGLTLGRLVAALGEAGGRSTVLVDACYTSLKVDRVDSGSAVGAPSAPAPGARVVLGAGLWDVAYETELYGAWRGAFSVAISTVIQQWSTATEDGTVYVDGAMNDIVFRTRALLQNLGYDQRTVMASPGRALELPFLWPSASAPKGSASFFPDGYRKPRQVGSETDVPGLWVFAFSEGGGPPLPLLAIALSTGENGLTVNTPTSQYALGTGSGAEPLGQEMFLATQDPVDMLQQMDAVSIYWSSATEGANGYEASLYLVGQEYNARHVDISTETFDTGSGPGFRNNACFGPIPVNSTQGPVNLIVEFVLGSDPNTNQAYVQKVKWWVDQSGLSGLLSIGGTVVGDRITTSPGSGWARCPTDTLSAP